MIAVPHVLLHQRGVTIDISLDPDISPPFPHVQWYDNSLIYFSGMAWKKGVLICGGATKKGSKSSKECNHVILGSSNVTPYPDLNIAREKMASAYVKGRIWLTGGKENEPIVGKIRKSSL